MAPIATTTTTQPEPDNKVKNAHAKEDVYTSGNPDLAFPSETPTGPPQFSDPYEQRAYLKHRLALAFRVFAKFDFCDGVAGHITLRDPVDPTSFWVNPFGMHFSLITDDDLILVNHDGKVIEGGRNRLLNYAAFAIHSEIHAARPDVLCAAHSHSLHGRAFCATGRKLQMLTQDHCVFHNDHALYPNFAGVVLAAEEGKHIAATFGSKKAILLGNHGLLTAGQTIEEVVFWFQLLDRCCHIQLEADASAAGSGVPLVEIGEVEARSTWEALGRSGNGYFMALPIFQLAELEFGERTFLGRGV
ncbi:MAG: hypothetical protein M1834_009319 [Cirrosporium novae-zelandiae]|nr:MAG: hypothetical protein M1834_009319 [Cirrosporium novae-zelandiae]